MKVKFSLWASDARVLLVPPEDLEEYMISIRPGWQEENNYSTLHGYVWLSNHEQEVVLPRLEDRIAGIAAATQEQIQKVRAEAEKQVQGLQKQLAEILSLTYESPEGGHNVMDA